MATGTEIKEKLSALPVLPGSLEGFYVLGSKDTESGEPESYKCNLGFVEAAANAANEAAGVAQEKASLAQEKAAEAENAAGNANEKASEAEQAKQDVLAAQETIEAAEQERASAETERKSSEQERQTAEQTRSENETSRQTSETQRQESELARAEAEEARAEAEQARQEAETSRKQAERPYSRIDQVAGPMFDVTYPSLDYAYAKDYFENHAPQVNPAGCSALVKNGVLVRSYDWKRKTADGKTICSFAVHTPAAQGHFAVVGMAGGLDALTEDVVEARQFSEAYKILPFCMQDGKNEKDLFAEMNVVPTWHNTRTVPAVEKRESISAIMLVRYILDNFQTVDEAVAYLQNYVEVYMPTNLDEMGYELHFLIADATKSVAIEFVDNVIVAIETDKLTNFHLSGVTLNEDGSVYTNADVADGNLPSSQGIEDYAGGLERFNILNTATDPVEAIKAVVFSKAYTDLVNVWFSEFVGGDLTVNTRADDPDLLARIAEYRQKWEDQDNDVWISVHQSIYRLGVAGLDVTIREGNDEHFVPISDHAQAQLDHSLAENDHSTAQEDHEQASTDHQQAEIDHSNTEEAIEACNEAKEAIEANETTRQTNEQSRQTAEQARSNAESARQTAEEARVQQAASDHTTAQSDHTQAGTDHTQAGQDHTTAQSDHTTAQTDHTNAVNAANACTEAKEAIEANEAARQAAEAARVTEEARRVAEYGQFEFDINEALDCIEGRNDIPAWEEDDEGGSTRAFRTGEYCKHNWTDPVTGVTKSYAFRFLSPVAIGDAWDAEKVVQTSVFGELKEMVIGDQEATIIGISSADEQMEVSGISVIIQNITKGTTQTLETGDDGTISLLLDKGDVIDITAAQQSGYQKPGTVRHKATMNKAYVYIVYQTQPDICTITAMLKTEHGNVIGVGDTIGLTLDDNTTILATVDENGTAVFENVPYGHTGSIRVIKHAGFTTPAPQTVDTSHSTITLDFVYVASGVGILMVREDGSESPLEDWAEGDTLVAIHVNTEDLLDNNADYYIKPECLADTWFVSANNKQWATQNVNFPNVPADSATDYNGEGNTAAMLADAADLEISSPAASFAVAQSFTLGGHTAIGFIGTKRQMNPIFENKDLIYSMLTLGGFTPAYYNKNIWTSTQYSATFAWYWGSGDWNISYKNNSNAVVPFFAI